MILEEPAFEVFAARRSENLPLLQWHECEYQFDEKSSLPSLRAMRGDLRKQPSVELLTLGSLKLRGGRRS